MLPEGSRWIVTGFLSCLGHALGRLEKLFDRGRKFATRLHLEQDAGIERVVRRILDGPGVRSDQGALLLCLSDDPGFHLELGFVQQVLGVHPEVAQVRGIAPRFPGLTAYRLGLARDGRVEVPKRRRHRGGDSRRPSDVRLGVGDRPDGFLVAVEEGGDAPFGLRELLSEHVLRWRASRGGALVLELGDFAPQARDVLPQPRILPL